MAPPQTSSGSFHIITYSMHHPQRALPLTSTAVSRRPLRRPPTLFSTPGAQSSKLHANSTQSCSAIPRNTLDCVASAFSKTRITAPNPHDLSPTRRGSSQPSPWSQKIPLSWNSRKHVCYFHRPRSSQVTKNYLQDDGQTRARYSQITPTKSETPCVLTICIHSVSKPWPDQSIRCSLKAGNKNKNNTVFQNLVRYRPRLNGSNCVHW